MVYEHRLYLPAVGPFVLFSLMVIRGMEKLRYRVSVLKPRWGLIKQGPDKNMKKFVGDIVDWFVLSLIVVFLFAGTYQRNLYGIVMRSYGRTALKSPQTKRGPTTI